MGVKTLNRFIHQYPVQLLRDLDLHHATIIIDGSELLYHLYFDHDNGRRGGEYVDFRRIIRDFFNKLIDGCSITCYVVFDRFKSENNIPRYLETRTNKLLSVISIVDGIQPEHGVRALPLLAKTVLKQTLHELNVPYIVVSGDGDAELAAIANELNGYVLATDTDFCVFPLTQGFLPLDDFMWRQAKKKCPCKVFHRRNLEQIFRIHPRAVAFLEALLSKQDGLQQVDFTPFFRALPAVVQIPRNLRNIRFRRPDTLENLLIWLGNEYRNDDDTISLIRRYIPDLPVADFINCLQVYRNPPDVSAFVDDLHQGGHSFGPDKPCFYGVGGAQDRADFLPILPDDPDRPSCNKMSASIRYAIYQIGIMREREQASAEDTQILVTDRRGREYGADFVSVTVNEGILEPMHVDLNDNMLSQRDDKQEIMELREEFILDVLSRGENHDSIDAFNNETKLLAAIFKYWATSTNDDERQVDEAVKALAFTLSTAYHGCDLIAEMTQIPESTFNKAALHSSSQWLCCVKDAMKLNVVLGKPLACTAIGRLFSGTLYQRAFSYFVGRDGQQAGVIFPDDADARILYEQLMGLGSE